MAVLAPDGLYRLIKPKIAFDASRSAVRDYTAGTPVGSFVGARVRQEDLTWHIRLDPSAWPVAQGDLVVSPDGTRFIVLGEPMPVLHQPNDPNSPAQAAAYIQVSAAVQQGLRQEQTS